AASESLRLANGEAAERVASLAASTDREAADLAQEGGEQVGVLTACVEGLESDHSSSLGQCVLHIEDHVEEACAVRDPSGGTPGKKSYPRPETFSTTRPHEEIMSEIRGGNLEALFASSEALLPQGTGTTVSCSDSASTVPSTHDEEEEEEEHGGQRTTDGLEEDDDAQDTAALADTAVAEADATTPTDQESRDVASPGAENRSAKETGGSGGATSPTAGGRTTGVVDLKSMKEERASRIAARTSVLSAAGEGSAAAGGGGGGGRPAPLL
ncbi:unnamed protein product, partial [Ectocarpus fasciculatus]